MMVPASAQSWEWLESALGCGGIRSVEVVKPEVGRIRAREPSLLREGDHVVVNLL